MTTQKTFVSCVVALVCMISATTAAQSSLDQTVGTEPSVEKTGAPVPLGVGSPAPPLSVAQWVVGDAIDGFEPGQVYVVEFWATWCPPSKTSIPHLSELQQEYGDRVEFVSVTRETEATVQDFLAKEQSPGKTWGEVVQHRLAVDSASITNEAYMKAAGQNGIPTAFIVGKDAVVEWIGHPMKIDEPLAQIVAGEWDRQAAIAQFEKRQRPKQLSQELRNKVRAKLWDDALSVLDQLELEVGKSSQTTGTRLTILRQAGRTEEVVKLQVELSWDSAQLLNQIARGITTGEEPRDLDLALKAAQRASELREDEDAATLDTLARVYYELGQLDEATQWQKKAVEHSQGNQSIEAALKKYEAEKAAQTEEQVQRRRGLWKRVLQNRACWRKVL